MDRWCREFDNWAFCDAMSFNLFDRSRHAWAKVTQWSSRRNEFEKRWVGKDALLELTSARVRKAAQGLSLQCLNWQGHEDTQLIMRAS